MGNAMCWVKEYYDTSMVPSPLQDYGILGRVSGTLNQWAESLEEITN